MSNSQNFIVHPTELDFGTFYQGERLTLKFTITLNPNHQRVLNSQPLTDYFRRGFASRYYEGFTFEWLNNHTWGTLKEAQITDNYEYQLTLSVDTQNLPIGQYQDWYLIRTQSGEQSRIKVSFRVIPEEEAAINSTSLLGNSGKIRNLKPIFYNTFGVLGAVVLVLVSCLMVSIGFVVKYVDLNKTDATLTTTTVDINNYSFPTPTLVVPSPSFIATTPPQSTPTSTPTDCRQWPSIADETGTNTQFHYIVPEDCVLLLWASNGGSVDNYREYNGPFVAVLRGQGKAITGFFRAGAVGVGSINDVAFQMCDPTTLQNLIDNNFTFDLPPDWVCPSQTSSTGGSLPPVTFQSETWLSDTMAESLENQSSNNQQTNHNQRPTTPRVNTKQFSEICVTTYPGAPCGYAVCDIPDNTPIEVLETTAHDVLIRFTDPHTQTVCEGWIWEVYVEY